MPAPGSTGTFSSRARYWPDRRLEEHREVCNPEEILIGYAHDGIDQRKTLRNIERFATEVMPHFQGTAPRESLVQAHAAGAGPQGRAP